MDFVGNLLLFAAAKNLANQSSIDKVIGMVRVAQFFLTHSVVLSFHCTSLIADMLIVLKC